MDPRNIQPNHSLVAALTQLNIDRPSRRRRNLINKLPNEILRAILGRVQAHHLIRLRLVDRRWAALIEDIWTGKKCLMIGPLSNEDCLRKLSQQMNGHLKLSTDFVFLQLKTVQHKGREDQLTMSGHLCALLPKLFPNIEQFFLIEEADYPSTEFNFSTEFNSMLSQWSSTLSTLSLFGCSNQSATDLYAQLNQLTSLKRLDLNKFSFMAELAPTFARLEHFSMWGIDAIQELVPFLGEGFCSLGLNFGGVQIGDITNWLQLNARFVRTLVHLSFMPFDSRVFSFVCEHFTSLRMLRFLCMCGSKFSTDKIANLARLTHLADLQIDYANIELATFDVAKLTPLASIRTFSLVEFTLVSGRFVTRNCDVALFSRILSITFPNVTKLTVKSEEEYDAYSEIPNLLKAHLNQFPRLRSFNAELDNSIVRLMK